MHLTKQILSVFTNDERAENPVTVVVHSVIFSGTESVSFYEMGKDTILFLKDAIYVKFPGIMQQGIMFWVVSPNYKMLLTLQRKIVRLMASVKHRIHVGVHIRDYELLALACELIFILKDVI
jgi:hypothetical protein